MVGTNKLEKLRLREKYSLEINFTTSNYLLYHHLLVGQGSTCWGSRIYFTSAISWHIEKLLSAESDFSGGVWGAVGSGGESDVERKEEGSSVYGLRNVFIPSGS
jgi:hypothetical protein